MELLPRLGKEYDLEIETISKPREHYRTAEYRASGLPPAPALMIGDELLVQGGPIGEDVLEAALRRHIGFTELVSQCKQDRPRHDL